MKALAVAVEFLHTPMSMPYQRWQCMLRFMQCTRELYFAFKAHLEEQARLRQQRIEAQRSNGAANGASVDKTKLKVPVVGKVLEHAASTLWEHVKGNEARLSALLEAFRTFQTVCSSSVPARVSQ